MTQPQRKLSPSAAPHLETARDKALARIGVTGDLVPNARTSRELAEDYIQEFSLDPNSPDAQVCALKLAIIRFKELTLMAKIEEAIHRGAENHGTDYGEELLRLAKSAEHRALHAEAKRLHSEAMSLRRELSRMSEEG